MKGFQGFQQVTGPGGKKPGPNGGANSTSSNPYAAKAPGGGGGNNNNKNKNKNKGGGGTPPPTPLAPPVAPTPQTSATPVTDANTPGAISTIATDKPLDYFSGLLSGQGQMNTGGPSVYQNYLQNQFFNDVYSKHMAQFEADPLKAPDFDQYLTNTYGGNAGVTNAAQRAFNLATPTQRGDFNNVFNNSTGRTQFWG